MIYLYKLLHINVSKQKRELQFMTYLSSRGVKGFKIGKDYTERSRSIDNLSILKNREGFMHVHFLRSLQIRNIYSSTIR